MQGDIKMSKLASCGGCGAKVGAGMLSQILQGIPTVRDENLLVGYDTSDDAAVYKVSDDLAIVQTLDFFPPIVDDPFMFGQIAAANAISDVYAMGATPKIALNIMTVTPQMSKEMIHEVLRGGYEKAYEAGVVIAGGHTINDQEPKYGLSVTGFARPDEIRMNCTPSRWASALPPPPTVPSWPRRSCTSVPCGRWRPSINTPARSRKSTVSTA